ncbi:MAG TPA: hypothetical protein VJ827_06275 [Rubrobacter sp.]|nr:hypothetical protein [Rubrobacter sp.]
MRGIEAGMAGVGLSEETEDTPVVRFTVTGMTEEQQVWRTAWSSPS